MISLQEVFGLSSAEGEQFRRVANDLVSHTFLLRSVLTKEGEKVHRNPDYLFVERHVEVFESYFLFMDWRLVLDTHNGYCYLLSEHGGNRLTLTKDQTALFLCLRLLYEEKLADLGSETDVVVSLQEILDKMITDFGILKGYNRQKMGADLSTCLHYRVLMKKKGGLQSTDSLFVIMPTILTAVPTQRLHGLVQNLKKMEEEQHETAQSSASDQLAPL
ncbi:MAG: DUF4194 domain-containing protein [Eubacteriales bacterium]